MKQSLIIYLLLLVSCTPQKSGAEEQEKKVVYATLGSSPIDEQKERKYTLMEREIEYLMNIWPGEYDNVEQLSFEKDAGRNSLEKGQHQRIHSTITRVYNESLSEYLLYIEEYQQNDTNNIYRQQLYELLPEDENRSIRVRLYDLKNAQKLWRSSSAQNQIRQLKKSSFSLSQSCDLIIQREGKEFIGKTEGPDCQVNSDDTSIDLQIKISKENYGFRYRKVDGDFTPESSREDWFMLDKARCFVCMIDFPREPGGRPVNTKYYVDIHDQGGQFEFDYDDGRHMVLTMRNTWSYGMQRNTFVIVIQEESLDGPTLIYSWGSDGADRIGMNPGWIRIQCDLKNEKNVKLQQNLRPDS